jgi:hypothetical protein
MVAIPFPTTTAPGTFAERGGRLVNAYVDKLDDGRNVWRRVAGLRRILNIAAHVKARGFIEVNGTLYVAMKDRLYTVVDNGDGAYTASDVAALAGEDKVYFARNNKSPTPDVVAVTDGTAYVVTPSSVAGYPDADVGAPNSVTFQGGYFIFSYGNARMRHTALNDTAINTLDTAFAESRPDGLLRVVPDGDSIVAFGNSSLEIWRNSGEETGFAYARSSVIDKGLISAAAITGHEPGSANAITWVADDASVYRLQGNQAVKVSTPAIDALIRRVSDKSTISACVYVQDGHPCAAISCDDWTLVYDERTTSWFYRQSRNLNRWRVTETVRAFGLWIAGDLTTGNLYAIDPDYQREGDDPLVVTIESAGMSAFPKRATLQSLTFDILAGTGLAPGEIPIQTAPRVMLSWSLDGGNIWGVPLHREIGGQAGYVQQVKVNTGGLISDRGFKARVSFSDPVRFALFSGDLAFKQVN